LLDLIFPTVIPKATPITIKNINMIGTIPSKNGDGTNFPSSPRNGLSGSNITPTTSATYTNPAMTALINPFLALGSSSVSSSSTSSPSYLPNLGSMNFDVTRPPTMVKTNTDTILKYQLSTAVTIRESSNKAADSVEIPANKASVPATKRFAVNPAPAPAYPAASPANGCLPTL